MYVPELIRKEGLRRGLSPRTIKTYCFCVNKFLKSCNKDVKEITKKDVTDYIDKFLEKGAAGNTINVYLNSIKFLMENVLNRRHTYNIKYSKVPKKLPTFLTKEETVKLIDSIKNEKHKLMIQILYSAGLRVSELINLKIKDFEFSKNYGWVREGKGNKDRYFILAEKLNNKLQDFIKLNSLEYKDYLFKGNKRQHISKETIGAIIKNAAKLAKIEKNVHAHTLRHSFATHLIENGYSVNEVQSLLGHNSSETTMIYVHMANPKMINVRSPLDSL
jgi:integrase/recombinase XerD